MDKFIQDLTEGYNHMIKDFMELYDQIKGRNTGERIFDCDFGGKIVTTFIKEGYLDSGSRQGICGIKKDNKRIYCCQQCYSSRI